MIVKRLHKIAVGGIAAVSLGFGAIAFAHPGGMGGPMGPGMSGGMGPGMMMHGGFAGPMAAQQLMTPEERANLADKMRNAKTPEERQKLAEANRAEMQKRAKEKGITFPPHGPGAGFGPNFGPNSQAPAR